MTREEFIKLLEHNGWKKSNEPFYMPEGETREFTKNRLTININYSNVKFIEIYGVHICTCQYKDALSFINNVPELAKFKLEPLPRFDFWNNKIIEELYNEDLIFRLLDNGDNFCFNDNKYYLRNENNLKTLQDMKPFFDKLERVPENE